MEALAVGHVLHHVLLAVVGDELEVTLHVHAFLLSLQLTLLLARDTIVRLEPRMGNKKFSFVKDCSATYCQYDDQWLCNTYANL